MADNHETINISDFKDRKTGLVIFGILQILMGAFCALAVPLTILAMVVSATTSQPASGFQSPRIMISGILFYVVLAVWFIWMGIGSIKARRWARTLLLVTSWIWLVSGIIGTVLWLVLMPDMYAHMAQSGQMPQQVVAIVEYMTAGFVIGLYVVLPAIFVLFYGSRHVKGTCEHRDPHTRWTDKCPLPVLAVSVIFGLSAFCTLWTAFYGFAVPFFGILLSGAAGAAVVLISALLSGLVAWGTYKLKIMAWWGARAMILAWAGSAIITFSRVGLMELYERMQFPEDQIKMIEQWGMADTFNIPLWTALWAIVLLAYLAYAKRYFVVRSNGQLNTIQAQGAKR